MTRTHEHDSSVTAGRLALDAEMSAFVLYERVSNTHGLAQPGVRPRDGPCVLLKTQPGCAGARAGVHAPQSSAAAGGPAGRCCRRSGLLGRRRVSEMMPPGTAAMSSLRDTTPVAQPRAAHAGAHMACGFYTPAPFQSVSN